MTTRCSQCGETIEANAEFCGSCGARQARTVACPHCGRQADSGNRFCGFCGQDLKAAAGVTTLSPPDSASPPVATPPINRDLGKRPPKPRSAAPQMIEVLSLLFGVLLIVGFVGWKFLQAPSTTSDDNQANSANTVTPAVTPTAQPTPVPTQIKEDLKSEDLIKIKQRLAQLLAQREKEQAAEVEAQRARRLVNGVVEELSLLRRHQENGRLTAARARAAQRKLQAALVQAHRHSEQAIQLDAKNATAWVQKVRALYYLDKYHEAGSTLRQALNRFPNNPALQQQQERIANRLR
jgi:TolA-binding protein